MVNGVKVSNNLQLPKSGISTFDWRCETKGGHSSVPTADNAIYRRREALVRVSQVEFP